MLNFLAGIYDKFVAGMHHSFIKLTPRRRKFRLGRAFQISP